jgi:hypothetical protein
MPWYRPPIAECRVDPVPGRPFKRWDQLLHGGSNAAGSDKGDFSRVCGAATPHCMRTTAADAT